MSLAQDVDDKIAKLTTEIVRVQAEAAKAVAELTQQRTQMQQVKTVLAGNPNLETAIDKLKGLGLL